jgi:hypothetical protein
MFDKFPSIETIAGGAIKEAFDNELIKVGRDIADPNTNWKTARAVIIEVTLNPDETREIASVNISCKSKLAGAKPVPTTFFIGERKGLIAITEKHHPNQAILDLEQKEKELDADLKGQTI